MSRNPASVETLKKFYRDRDKPLDVPALVQELANANDRSIVTCLAAFLDNALELRLRKYMREMSPAEVGALFGAEKCLGPFSAKIDLAYFLKHLKEDERERLHAIREMRNACAHSRHAVSFNDPAMAAVCKRTLPDETIMGLKYHDSTDGLRNQFIIETLWFAARLSGGNNPSVAVLVDHLDRLLKLPEPSASTQKRGRK